MPRVICVVQARLGSSRLPGKSMRALAGKPMIAHVMERAQRIKGVDYVVLATTARRQDDALALWGMQSHDVDRMVRGSESDVLSRFATAAADCDADVIMRLTGDCPFIAPEVCSQVLDLFHNNPLNATFASNDTTCSWYPDGMDVEVFSRELLDVANARATDQSDREHVTKWMRREVCTVTLRSDIDYSAHKISVDREEDYALARLIAEQLKFSDDYSLDATMRVVQKVTAHAQ